MLQWTDMFIILLDQAEIGWNIAETSLPVCAEKHFPQRSVIDEIPNFKAENYESRKGNINLFWVEEVEHVLWSLSS